MISENGNIYEIEKTWHILAVVNLGSITFTGAGMHEIFLMFDIVAITETSKKSHILALINIMKSTWKVHNPRVIILLMCS